LTGYESVYALFRKVVESESEKHYMSTFNDTFVRVKERLKTITRELGIPEDTTKGFQPEFPQESIALHIVNEMDIGNIGNFEIMRDPKGSRNVVLNNKWFLIQGFHQTLADNLASKLNSIVHDPKIREDLTNYRTVREKRDISISQFEEHLETLLHGIEL
jgi:hypothetical protein